MNAPKATLDYESRSACDLKTSGAWRYSIDPSTEVLCFAFRLPTWAKGEVALWHPKFPHLGIEDEGDEEHLADLLRFILAGGLVEAHNSWFEFCLWRNICQVRYGWPEIPHAQWRCSAAKAAVHALPRDLKDAGKALHLGVTKDTEGGKVMMKMNKPRKPRKKEVEEWKAEHGKTPMPRLYHESPELLDRLWSYCCQDVLAEEALSAALPDLSPQETEYYLMDQAINLRGFQLDKEAVTTALAITVRETKVLTEELGVLTEGQVERATQRERMKGWLEGQGLALENTQAATLEDTLTRGDLTPEARRGVELMQLLGKSSTAKYKAMQAWAGADWRIRGGLLYHGASTGRWTAKGVQPHNLPKGKIKDDMELAWEIILTQDRVLMMEYYESVMRLLSHALRGTIIPSRGKKLFVGDFAQIEARVLLWLAEDEDALDLFRNAGEDTDIYCAMATDIYKRPVTKHDAQERALGKVAILGLGYQMGVGRFVDTCTMMAGIEITEQFSQEVVNAYRTKFWRVKQLWYDMEAAAIEAVTSKRPVSCGKVTWVREGWFLYCVLPSGRKLAYPNPKVGTKRMSWGEDKPALTFWGVNPLTHKWQKQFTYGGMLVENATQSVARDLMAAALQRCEDSKVYKPVLSVHDEMLSEAHPLLGSVEEFATLMAQTPDWAEGLPVEADGFSGFRYRK